MEDQIEALGRARTRFDRMLMVSTTPLDLPAHLETGEIIEMNSFCFIVKHKLSEKCAYIVSHKTISGFGFGFKTNYVQCDKEGNFDEQDMKVYCHMLPLKWEEIAVLGMWATIGSYATIQEFELASHVCRFGCLYCDEQT